MPTPGSPRYSVDNTPLVFDWLAGVNDPDRRSAMFIWVRAVCHDPDFVTTGRYRHSVTGREFCYSDVPGAHTRVTFVVFDTPARCVRIVRINDEDYELP